MEKMYEEYDYSEYQEIANNSNEMELYDKNNLHPEALEGR